MGPTECTSSQCGSPSCTWCWSNLPQGKKKNERRKRKRKKDTCAPDVIWLNPRRDHQHKHKAALIVAWSARNSSQRWHCAERKAVDRSDVCIVGIHSGFIVLSNLERKDVVAQRHTRKRVLDTQATHRSSKPIQMWCTSKHVVKVWFVLGWANSKDAFPMKCGESFFRKWSG